MIKTRRSGPDIHKQTRRNAKKDGNGFDAIIVGGGMAGGTMAALLGTHGFHVACIDRDPPAAQMEEAFDGRTIAISWGSQKVLAEAGVWAGMKKDACPIDDIDILDGNSPVLLRFSSEEVGGRTFGWIVETRIIRKALFGRLRDLETVDHLAPAGVRSIDRNDDAISVTLEDGRVLRAALLIGADGRQSFTREWAGIGTRGWDYRQTALVCTVEHENPHHNLAVEHFRAHGPFAILPMTPGPGGEYRSSIVWTEHGAETRSAMALPQDVFDASLNARFPASYGRVRQVGRRFSYPLTLQHAYRYTAPRLALIADAAHGIHPIAGQGLNLGLRDIAGLYECLEAARDRGGDLGGEDVLKEYERMRRFDNMAMAGTTDALTWLFSNDSKIVGAVRRAGLRMVANLPPAKNFFMQQAMGAAGLLPDMIREAGTG